MKNLILKIIRGSYPPISPKYSYDIRHLVSGLLKKRPEDRPSLDNILRKSYIKRSLEQVEELRRRGVDKRARAVYGRQQQQPQLQGYAYYDPVIQGRQKPISDMYVRTVHGRRCNS